MNSTWSISGAGTFEALGLGSLQATFLSQAPDRVTFTAPGAFDAAALFPYKSLVTILKDGAPWFTGTVTSIPRQGSPVDERITYELQGPWWNLEKILYSQIWKLYEGGALGDHLKTRCILNQKQDGTRLTTSQQIEDALDVAIAAGAPFAKGTIDAGFNVPWEEVLDVSCADVIVRQLRLSPDVVCWFDYTVNPPVFHCRKVSSLTSKTVTFPDGGIESIALTPRHDLQLPGVEVIFEKTVSATIAGKTTSYCSVSRQTAGNYAAWDAMRITLPLAGSEAWEIADVETEDWPVAIDNTQKAWLKSHFPSLKNEADADFSILSATRKYALSGGNDSLPRLVKEGSEIPVWLTSVNAFETVVTVKISRTKKGKDGSVVGKATEQPIAFNVISTSAVSKHYWHFESSDYEDEPADFAAALYAAWNRLQYDGQVVLIEHEVGAYSIGNRLDIEGGLVAWLSMDAQIQQITQDVDSGRTTLTIGPPRRVSPGDLASFLRTRRLASSTNRQKERVTGKSTDGKTIVKGGGKPGKNEPCAHDAGDPEKQSYSTYNSTPEATARIDLDAGEIAATSDYKVFQKQIISGVPRTTWDWTRAHS